MSISDISELLKPVTFTFIKNSGTSLDVSIMFPIWLIIDVISVGVLASKITLPVPERELSPKISETLALMPELITTLPTFEKPTALVRKSTTPSSIVIVPPARSIELFEAKTKVSLSAEPKSKVRLPPSRSTLISAVSVLSTVSSGIVITTSPTPVMAPVALTKAACVKDRPSFAPVDTTKVAAPMFALA